MFTMFIWLRIHVLRINIFLEIGPPPTPLVMLITLNLNYTFVMLFSGIFDSALQVSCLSTWQLRGTFIEKYGDGRFYRMSSKVGH